MAETGAGSAEPVYLVDGSGYIFRAFYGLPPMTNPEGVPVNAVFGFSKMLAKLLSDAGTRRFAVIFDSSRVSFRNDIFPDYKANRSDPPEELVPQFGLIRDATRAFNVPCIELPGFEADDLIATFARMAREEGHEVVIVSSDKDLMQLVGDGVSMLDPAKNLTIGREEVIERFGVGPESVIDVQALAGDSTDNVPGVPGIGVKTAAELIRTYGDLDTLLDRADEIKQPKRRQNLIENADMARVSRDLVTLRIDAPVTQAVDELVVAPPDAEVLNGFLREHGFKSMLAQVGAATAAAGADEAAAAPGPEAAERDYSLGSRRGGARALDRRRDARRRGRRRHRDHLARFDAGGARRRLALRRAGPGLLRPARPRRARRRGGRPDRRAGGRAATDPAGRRARPPSSRCSRTRASSRSATTSSTTWRCWRATASRSRRSTTRCCSPTCWKPGCTATGSTSSANSISST